MTLHVDASAVTAVLLGGDWVNVTAVVIDFAEFDTGLTIVTARGSYLSAKIVGGPNNGHTFVTRLSDVAALRL